MSTDQGKLTSISHRNDADLPPELYQAIYAVLIAKGLTKSAKALGKDAAIPAEAQVADEGKTQKLLSAWEIVNVAV
jgi:hypothetical protein